MARTTKLELEQLLATRNAEVQDLRLRLAVADGNVVAYRAKCEELETQLRGTKSPRALAASTPYRVALERAREAAMRTGRCVRVG